MKIQYGIALLFLVAMASAAVFPSTNEANVANNWAYVEQVSVGAGEVTLKFVQPRNFYACFEVRTDGDTSEVLAENGGNNYNALVSDGLYTYYCVKAGERTETISADSYVEVRMAFGAESDERFDWTTFDVLPVQNDVPEFGVIGAAAALAGVGAITFLKRK